MELKEEKDTKREVWEIVMNSTTPFAMQLKRRYLYARKRVLQTISYINAYLEDYNLDIKRSLNQHPIEFTIRVHWLPSDMTEEEVIETLKKKEEEKIIEFSE